ncbi:MAG: hypothetical protein ACPF8W_08635, partial [Luminiphilus sp.]
MKKKNTLKHRGVCSHTATTNVVRIATLASFLTPMLASGQTDLEETVVIASRVPTPLSEVGISVDVLDRELIALLAYRDLSSLL